MSDAIMGTSADDNHVRLRAFAAAVEHRAAMHQLVDQMKVAFTLNEVGRIVAEMSRLGNEYEAWLRAENARLQAQPDQRVDETSLFMSALQVSELSA